MTRKRAKARQRARMMWPMGSWRCGRKSLPHANEKDVAMKVRNRILYLRQKEEDSRKLPTNFLSDDQHEEESSKCLFDCVLDELHEALLARMGRCEALPNWPNGEWNEGSFECQVRNWTAQE